MRVEHQIAWRYLFSKKSHNAINIVSGVSAAGVMVATAALVCVLSVMNGFSKVVEGMFSQFDAPLRIEPAQGKYFRLDSEEMLAVMNRPDVSVFAPTIEETALVQYKDHQVPATLKGVSDEFQQLTHIDSIISDGFYSVYDGAFERCVLGRGLAATIGINAHFVGGMKVYAPKRKERVNMMRPDRSLNKASTFIAGTFAVNQLEYDDHMMLVSLPFARQLFDYDEQEATAVELALVPGTNLGKEKKAIRQTLGENYVVLDRYEQQADFFRISKIEKMLTLLLLSFILLIATFNIIGSLSMLMIEKHDDSLTLRNMGATPQMLRRIFLTEGWLISALGALIGLVIGLVICLLQEHFGIIKLGTGADYVLSAYPVAVQATDILLVGIIVLAIGYISAAIPTRQLLRTAPLLLLLMATSCTHRNRPKPVQTDLTFDYGFVTRYGAYYADGGLDNNVYMLDVYSPGLRLNKEGYMEGSGYNLCLSDVFTLPTDSVLLEGITYQSDTTGRADTFLPGQDFEGNVNGAYLLNIADGQIASIMLFASGSFELLQEGDTTHITFELLTPSRQTYKGTFRAPLPYKKHK